MLWGMFWFIFSITSYAYSNGLPDISPQYSLAARALSLALSGMFAAIGVIVLAFFYGLWHVRSPTDAKESPKSRQAAPTAISMVKEQGGNPLMEMSGDQRAGQADEESPKSPLTPRSPPPRRAERSESKVTGVVARSWSGIVDTFSGPNDQDDQGSKEDEDDQDTSSEGRRGWWSWRSWGSGRRRTEGASETANRILQA